MSIRVRVYAPGQLRVAHADDVVPRRAARLEFRREVVPVRMVAVGDDVERGPVQFPKRPLEKVAHRVAPQIAGHQADPELAAGIRNAFP